MKLASRELGPEEALDQEERVPQPIRTLVRALVTLFMPLIALGLGFLVERRFDSAWAMLGTVAACFMTGGILFPGEPL